MKYTKANQNEFLIALKNGEPDAFTELVQSFNAKLFAYAMSLINDRAMAQDLVQNVFLKTWVNRNKLNITKSLNNFLYKSVYNEFINQYRKNQAVMVLEQLYVDTLQVIVNESDDDSISHDQMIGLMKKEIDRLPKKCKRIFLLSKEEGLTNHEIADYLELSVKTVESQITNAFSTLRKKMKKSALGILFFIYRSNNFKTKSSLDR